MDEAHDPAGARQAVVVYEASREGRAFLEAYGYRPWLVALEDHGGPQVLVAVADEERPRLSQIKARDAELSGRQVFHLEPHAKHIAFDAGSGHRFAVRVHNRARYRYRPGGVEA